MELAHLLRDLEALAAPTGVPGARGPSSRGALEPRAPRRPRPPSDVFASDAHGGAGRTKAARPTRAQDSRKFDSAFQPSIRKTVVEHPGQLDFLEVRENVILLARRTWMRPRLSGSLAIANPSLSCVVRRRPEALAPKLAGC